MPYAIKSQTAGFENISPNYLAAARQRPEPHYKLADGKRLSHIIVADREHVHFYVHIVFNRENQDRDRGLAFSDQGGDFRTKHIWQVKIQHDDIILVGAGQGDATLACISDIYHAQFRLQSSL